jgi:hypothetical protein
MKDSAFLPSLIPLAVFVAGLDYVSGLPLYSVLTTFLSQNGF